MENKWKTGRFNPPKNKNLSVNHNRIVVKERFPEEEMGIEQTNPGQIEAQPPPMYNTLASKIDNKNIQNARIEDRITFPIKLKQILINFCNKTTAHGIMRFVDSEYRCLKIFWAIMFLGSFGYCSYTIVECFLDYFAFRVDTAIQVVRVSPAIFPAISICNHNPFNTKRSRTVIKKLSYLAERQLGYSGYWANDTRKAAFYLSKFLKTALYATNLSTPANDQFVGYTISDMLISCRFKTQDCYEKHFEWFHSYEFGNCYTYNNGKNYTVKTVSKPGWKNSLQIELFLGDPTTDNEYLFTRGAHLIIHNQSVVPLLEEEGIDIAGGTQTNVVIKRNYYRKLPKPYSDCISDIRSPNAYDSDLYRATFTLQNLNQYRQAFCYKLCYQRSLFNSCNCYDGTTPKLNDSVNFCQTSAEYSCLATHFDVFYDNDITALCDKDCPIECEAMVYSTSVSISNYPPNEYAKRFLENTKLISKFENFPVNMSQLKESVALIYIYFDEIPYQTIQDRPSLDLNNLIANLGGQLGFFIGISIMSFIEIFELMFLVIFTFLKYQFRPKKVHKIGG